MTHRGHIFSRCLIAAVLVLLSCFARGKVSAEAPALDDPALEKFIAAHVCVVEERLHMIRAAPRANPDSKDRFLTVAASDDEDRFAQCIFFDADTMVYCEAASGWYSGTTKGNRRLRLSSASIASLARLGFDTTVEEGNFRQEFAIGDVARDVRRVAELLLTTLHKGYGIVTDEPLTIVSPLAPLGYRSSRCHPTS